MLHNPPVISRALKVYQEVDPQLAKQATDLGATCKEGCAGCCHQRVALSFAEALVIAMQLLKEGRADHVLKWEKYDEPFCPFLKMSADSPWGGSCSIYAVRPLACRMHYVSTDPSRCAPDSPPEGILNTLEAQVVAEKAITKDDPVLSVVGPMPQFVVHAIKVIVGSTEPDVEKLRYWRQKLIDRVALKAGRRP